VRTQAREQVGVELGGDLLEGEGVSRAAQRAVGLARNMLSRALLGVPALSHGAEERALGGLTMDRRLLNKAMIVWDVEWDFD